MNIVALPRRWTPPVEGTCLSWLDASRLPSLYTTSGLSANVAVNGDPVGGALDLRGSNHYTQLLAGKRGAYDSTLLGIALDGVDDVLSTPNVILSEATIFVVAKRTTLASYGGLIKYAETDDTVSNQGRILYTAGASLATTMVMGNPATSWFRQYTHGSSPDGSKILLTFGWGSTATSTFVRVNGVAATLTRTSGTYPAITNAMPLHLGAGYSSSKMQSTILEALAFSAVLGATSIVKIEAYLKSRWGTP